MFQISSKLKALKLEFKKMQAIKRVEIGSRKSSLEASLVSLQALIDSQGLPDHDSLTTLSLLKAEALALANLEEEEAKQKSRLQWLKLGDRNNSFFHKRIKQRINRNSICKLVYSQGTEYLGDKEIGDHVVDYYSDLLSDNLSPFYNISLLSQYCGSRLNGN